MRNHVWEQMITATRRYGHYAGVVLVLLCALILKISLAQAAIQPGDPDLSADKYGIIPAPRSMKPMPGSFTLAPDTRLTINKGAAKEAAVYFRNFIAPATGYDLAIVRADRPESGAINLILSDGFASPEGYALSVSPDKIVIRASDKAGLFYGLQSLRQMLPPQIESAYPFNNVKWRIAGVKIKDQPLYSYRGMHLDVSRHFFSKDFAKRYIDFLALHKMNVFHWHLTDDQGWRIEIKKYPRLTSVGSRRPQTVIGHPYDRVHFYDRNPVEGFYSQEDIKEIVEYARRRQVTIIPEIDVPGHTSALLAAYPEYGCVKKDYKVKTEFHIFRDVMCPTEESFSFLADVFAEVAALFPGPYIHIGGDEVMKDQWKACKSCAALMKREGLKDYNALQSYFVRRVGKIITGLGKKMAGWEEILEGGIGPGAMITVWLDPKAALKAVRTGHDVVIGMSNKLYFNQFESLSLDEPMASSWQPPISLKDVYDYDLIPGGMTPIQARHVVGAQGHVWTNFIKTPAQVEHAALPRMSALAEILWSPKNRRSWPGFMVRVERLFRRLDLMAANASRAVYKVSARHSLVDGAVRIALSTTGGTPTIRYTLDGSRPTIHAPVYRAPLMITRRTVVRAVGQDPETGELYGDFRMTVVPHKALGKKITFLHAPRALYQPGPEKTILDGVIATDRIFHPTEWAEFHDGNLDAVIDFGEKTQIGAVSFGFDAGQYRRLYSPQAAQILISDDAKTWKTIKEVNEQTINRQRPFLKISFPAVRARYLRIIGVNNRKVFNTRLEKMVPVSIFIDEIVVH